MTLEKNKLTSEKMAFLLEIQKLEKRAYDLGLALTARALNKATNVSGWEISGNLNQAIKEITQ